MYTEYQEETKYIMRLITSSVECLFMLNNIMYMYNIGIIMAIPEISVQRKQCGQPMNNAVCYYFPGITTVVHHLATKVFIGKLLATRGM